MTAPRTPSFAAVRATADGPSSSTILRRRIASVAGHIEDEQAARRAFDDPAAPVRASGLVALIRMKRLTKLDFHTALADESPLLRSRLCETAGLISAAEPQPATTRHDRVPPSQEDVLAGLSRLLDDPVPAVVEAACFGIGEATTASSGDDAEPATDELVSKLSQISRNHPDLLCRESAVAALGSIGAPDGLSAVIEAMGGKPALRRRAIVALAAFDHAEASAAVERALSDRDWQVRQAAEDLCDSPRDSPAPS